jgi:hypothetical protein
MTLATDANGNTTAKGADTYGFDQANRIKTSTVAGVTSTYAYDGDGVRFSQTVGANPGSPAALEPRGRGSRLARRSPPRTGRASQAATEGLDRSGRACRGSRGRARSIGRSRGTGPPSRWRASLNVRDHARIQGQGSGPDDPTWRRIWRRSKTPSLLRGWRMLGALLLNHRRRPHRRTVRTGFSTTGHVPARWRVRLGSRHAWDDPTERDHCRRSSRDADVLIVDPNAVSDRRSVAPDAIDATSRSACCSAHRDGIQADRPRRQPPSLDARPAVGPREGEMCTGVTTEPTTAALAIGDGTGEADARLIAVSPPSPLLQRAASCARGAPAPPRGSPA